MKDPILSAEAETNLLYQRRVFKVCCSERVGVVPSVEVMLFQLSDVLGQGPRSQVAPVSAQVRVLGVCRYSTTNWLPSLQLDLLLDGIYMDNLSFKYSIDHFPVVIRALLSRETLSACPEHRSKYWVLDVGCVSLCWQSFRDFRSHLTPAIPRKISGKSLSAPTDHQQKKKFI